MKYFTNLLFIIKIEEIFRRIFNVTIGVWSRSSFLATYLFVLSNAVEPVIKEEKRNHTTQKM